MTFDFIAGFTHILVNLEMENDSNAQMSWNYKIHCPRKFLYRNLMGFYRLSCNPQGMFKHGLGEGPPLLSCCYYNQWQLLVLQQLSPLVKPGQILSCLVCILFLIYLCVNSNRRNDFSFYDSTVFVYWLKTRPYARGTQRACTKANFYVPRRFSTEQLSG